MLTLLNKDFPEYYNLNRKVIVVNQLYNSDFPLTDWKSCAGCQVESYYFYRQCLDKEVFKVSIKGNEGIYVINHEKYVQQYSDKPGITFGGSCDYLLCSTNKVAFVDLTCSRPSYIEGRQVGSEFKEGKRSVAFKQLKDSIARLAVCPTIHTYLQNCVKKDAILALRKKEFVFDVDSSPELHMQAFMKMSSEQAKSGMIQDMGNGFSFIVNEYPNVYVW